MAVPNDEKIIHNEQIQLMKTIKNPIPILLTLEIKHNNSNRFDYLTDLEVEADKEYEEDKLLEKQKKEITESTKWFKRVFNLESKIQNQNKTITKLQIQNKKLELDIVELEKVAEKINHIFKTTNHEVKVLKSEKKKSDHQQKQA